jgi:hypothetical protein
MSKKAIFILIALTVALLYVFAGLVTPSVGRSI